MTLIDEISLGERIRTRRGELDLRQVDLAEQMGCTQSVISCWETGRFFPPRSKWEQLAEVLGLSFADLFLVGGESE